MVPRNVSAIVAFLAAFSLATLALAAPVVLQYEGSFRAATGYYAEALAFAPDGAGAADRSQAVTGPTVLTIGQHGQTDDLREFSIPALVPSGSPNDATQILPATGGTQVLNVNTLADIGGADSVTVMGDEIWSERTHDRSVADWGVGRVKFGSDEDWTVDTNITRLQPYGLPAGNYNSSGLATKWDEADTLVATRWTYKTVVDTVDEGYEVYVTRHTKGAADPGDSNLFTWTSSVVFEYYVQDPDGVNNDAGNAALRYVNLEYVQVGSKKYYVLSHENDANTLVLNFFNAATATGVVAAPDFSIDVSSDITNGVGWWVGNSWIKDLAYDGNNRLYVLNTNNSGGSAAGYIHVFSMAEVPEPATMALLGLGFAGLAALRWTRRAGRPPLA